MNNDQPIACEWCGQPVLPESCVHLNGGYFHWECFWAAGRAVEERFKAVEEEEQ